MSFYAISPNRLLNFFLIPLFSWFVFVSNVSHTNQGFMYKWISFLKKKMSSIRLNTSECSVFFLKIFFICVPTCNFFIVVFLFTVIRCLNFVFYMFCWCFKCHLQVFLSLKIICCCILWYLIPRGIEIEGKLCLS